MYLANFNLIFLIIVGVKSEDPCQKLNKSSFCLTSGMCSPPLAISCIEAYKQASADLLKPFETVPPRFVHITPGQLSFARTIARNRQCPSPPVLPPNISENRNYKELISVMGILSTELTEQFPTISAQPSVLRRLVFFAEKVAAEIVAPLIEAGDTRTLTLFGCAFYATPSVVSVSYIARMGARYIASADLSIRSALLGNWIPIFHACSRVNRILGLPDLFARPAYVEFFTEAVKFDPLYEVYHQRKQWAISMVQHKNELVLPLLPPTEMDEFPLVVTETLQIDDSRPSPENMDRIIQQLVESMNMSFHEKLYVVRSALFYMSYFPGITDFDRTYFCAWSEFVWSNLLRTFTINANELESNNAITLIDLFRVCGKSYLSIEDRVRLVLPIVLAGSRFTERLDWSLVAADGTSSFSSKFVLFARIPIPILRTPILLKADNAQPTNETQHGIILSAFVQDILQQALPRAIRLHDMKSTTRMHQNRSTHIPLIVLGRAIGLLVVAGDPQGVLQTLLTDGSMPNLYMNSIFVRKGFCQVVDCNVFETLFSDNEIPAVLEICRNHKNILNPLE